MITCGYVVVYSSVAVGGMYYCWKVGASLISYARCCDDLLFF
jgi:hypothetical protein